jgi:hypothetical protein
MLGATHDDFYVFLELYAGDIRHNARGLPIA